MFDWHERRVLVTGATGIVGAHLCRALLERGAAVVALVRDHDYRSSFFRDGIAARCSIVSGELQRFEDCRRAIVAHETDVVFHLGAQTLVGTAKTDPLETFESNVRGSYNLLEAARLAGPIVRSFVVASSDKAYGDSPVLPYLETMPLAGRHPYDVSKSCTDLIASSYAETYGSPVTIARCGNIYGTGDLNFSRIVPGTIRSYLRGEAPVLRSDGSMIRDYIYVGDVVEAYLLLAESIDRPGVRGEAFNFSPESRVNVLEIVEAIRRVMGATIEPVILGTATHEIVDQTLDASKARAVLGWTCRTSLEDGLRATVPWYRTLLEEERVFENAV